MTFKNYITNYKKELIKSNNILPFTVFSSDKLFDILQFNARMIYNLFTEQKCITK